MLLRHYRRISRALAALCIASLLLAGGPHRIPAAPAPGELHALSAVLMDGDSGRVLYEKNGHEIRPMASTTKIMTCILVLELGNPGQYLEASSLAASMPKVRMGVRPGEKYRTGDLLYALMLESYNDAAVILAEGIAGSLESFAGLMNEKAYYLGCRDTYFITPNGLDASDETGSHATTAADLARLMAYCIKNEDFLQITGTDSYSFSDQTGRRSFFCHNHNALRDMRGGVISGKTGFTALAGYCYVGAVQSNGRRLIVALLGCGWPGNKSYKWSDCQKLFSYGETSYRYRTIHLDESDLPATLPTRLPVEAGFEDSIPLQYELPALTLLLRDDEQLRMRAILPAGLQAPVFTGSLIGHIEFYVGDVLLQIEPILAGESSARRSPSACLRRLAIWFLSFKFTEKC